MGRENVLSRLDGRAHLFPRKERRRETKMKFVLDYPLIFAVFILITLRLSEHAGVFWHKRRPNLEKDEREDFTLIAAAALTLLALIIGFTFSMAIERYNQRKNYEEDEANAIGTEYLRSDVLPATDGASVRALLAAYLDQRILFYVTRNNGQLRQIDTATARLGADLWSAVRVPASKEPTPVISLAVAGMNDVLNSQGYTRAAWLNRIPATAWMLMLIISIFCNFLIGYGMHRPDAKNILLFVLPFLVAISFFLIADIDSPRGGIIRMAPENLANLAHSLHVQ